MPSLDEVIIKIDADIKGAMAGIAKVETSVARMDKSFGKAAGSIRGTTGKIAKSLTKVGLVAAGAAAGLGIAFTKQAADMQTYMVTLEQLTGSQEAAAAKMKWLLDFAKATPFELPGLIEATTKLGAYGIKAEDTLRTLGDTAAAMGKPINMAVEALADAQTGEFERMKEFGIKAVVISKTNAEQLGATAEDVGMTALTFTDKYGKQQAEIVDRNNKEIITSTLMGIWNEKYAGGMEKQSHTLNGMVSNIKDAMYQGSLAIMGFDVATGSFKPDSLFTKAESAVKGLLDAIGEVDFAAIAAKVQEFVDNTIETISRLASELEPTWDNLKTIFSASIGIIKDIFGAFSDGSGDTTTLTDTINILTGALVKVFKWIDKHPNVTKLAMTLGIAATAFAYLLPIVVGVIGAITTIGLAISGAVGFFAAGGTAASALGIVIAALGGPITIIIAAIALLAAAWATNLFGIRDKTKAVMEVVKYWFDSTKELISNNSERIKTILLLLLGPIGAVILAFRNWDQIKEIVGNIVDHIKTSLVDLSNSAKSWGENLIQSFVDGIMSKVSAVTGAVSAIADKVEGYLGFSSPTKEGPGRNVMEWGPNLAKTFAAGIRSGMGSVNAAVGELTQPTTDATVDIIVKISDDVKEFLDSVIEKVINVSVVLSEIPTIPILSTVLNLIPNVVGDLPELPKTYQIIEYIKTKLPEIPTTIQVIEYIRGSIPSVPVLSDTVTHITSVFDKLPSSPIIPNLEQTIEYIRGVIPPMPQLPRLQQRIQYTKEKLPPMPDIPAIVTRMKMMIEPVVSEIPPLSTLLYLTPVIPTIPELIAANQPTPPPQFNNAFASLAAPTAKVGKGVEKSVSVQNTFHINIKDAVIRDDSDIDQIVSKIETALAKNSRSIGL